VSNIATTDQKADKEVVPDPSKGFSPKLTQILYGGDYNPEQWPEEIWQEDVRLMQEAGVNIVSLGIFSWARLEPRPGEYDFGWLDHIINLLYQHGIMIDLATATASPPPWLAQLHPESLPVTKEGARMWPGSRQHYCPSSPAYREAARKLVRQLATRYKSHPGLAMWHVGNEYACHVAECFCDISAAAFRGWLKKRYQNLEALNEAWGTAFWSQHYSDWSEINPPRLTPTFLNPSQQLDWKRFSSDAILECFEIEREVLKEITPNVPVTTNFMNFFKPLDYWKWAAQEDLVSLDCYPDPADKTSIMGAALNYDLIRSLGGGKPWLLMEQTTSHVNWRPVNLLKRPGQMRAWSYQALARGANGIMFFQWRASKAGAEKFHGALVPHIGTNNSRVWQEVKALGHELKGLTELVNTRVAAQVAIMFDWESWWALELDAKPSQEVKMLEQLQSYYEPLYRANIAVDFVPPWAELDKYKVVLVPNLYLVREEDKVAEKLEKFASAGGIVAMSFFSGIVDQNEHIRLGGYPAPFRALIGLWVEEFDPYLPGQSNTILSEQAPQNRYMCDLWGDVIHLEGAEPLFTYENDFYAGRAAITRHAYGEGFSYYLGTRPEPTLMTGLLEEICRKAGLAWAAFKVPEGVEVVRREGEQGVYTTVINHTSGVVEIEVPANGTELLTLKPLSHATLKLEPYGVVIIHSPEPGTGHTAV
jgi:beta-galactosidase